MLFAPIPVAELRDNRNNVIGFIQLTFTAAPTRAYVSTIARAVNVTAHVMRDLTQVGKIDPLKADYDSSDSSISVDDYMKDPRHAESNTAGRLRFTVSIAKANLVGAGVSKAALEPTGVLQKVAFARVEGAGAAVLAMEAAPSTPRGASYFEVSSIQVQVTVSDRQSGGQTAK